MLTTRCRLLALSIFALAGLASAAAGADDHPAVTLVKSKVKDPAKPFALIVNIKVKAGKEKELETTFAPCIAATKKEPGCIAYELNRDPDEPTTYFMYEKFKNIAALEAHLQTEHIKTFLSKAGDLLASPPELKFFAVVGE